MTIAYDDLRREVVWSNGERHRVDVYGNTLVEASAFGAGFVREYRILLTAEICLP